MAIYTGGSPEVDKGIRPNRGSQTSTTHGFLSVCA